MPIPFSRQMLVVLLVVAAAVAQGAAPSTRLTNADIVQLVKAGLPSAVITAEIQKSGRDFDTGPAALLALKSSGVPAEVILAMIQSSKPGDQGSPSQARLLDPLTHLFQQRRNSVVTVWSEFGQGTGFIVDAHGLILTNQHVVGPSTYLAVQYDPVHKVPARLLAADAARDVAVLWADISGFPGATIAPLAPVADGPSVEVGEEVFTIGSPMGVQKVLTTGLVSKVEAHAIFSNININHGNSGGPLFDSRGEAVGLTTFIDANEPNGPGISGIITLDQAKQVLDQARAEVAGAASPPPATELPVLPEDSYPVEALKEIAAQEKFDTKPYTFTAGKYDVALMTPPLEYWSESQASVRAAGSHDKRNRDAASAAMRPLDDLKNWQAYIGEYRPVLMIRADPELRESFMSALSRGLASASNDARLPPASLHYATDFRSMKLLCDGKEVPPISPGKIASLTDLHNSLVSISDATYQGLYIYQADAISPDCGKVSLEIYSEKNPDKPTIKELDDKTVRRIWDDFRPYRVQESAKH